jgi:DNA-binding NtrC family response regulator
MPKSKKTILVVEDSRALLMLYEKEFTAAGYKVLAFANLVDALIGFESHPVDLVLTDLILPDIKGTDLIPHLHLHSDIPVVVVTASGELKDSLPKEEPTIKAFFEKPVPMKTLIKAINKILDGKTKKRKK